MGKRNEETKKLLKTFNYHKPSEKGLKEITELREEFSVLQQLIEKVAPQSRERSVALTHLETTAMWAIKSVVFNDDKSEVAG